MVPMEMELNSGKRRPMMEQSIKKTKMGVGFILGEEDR